jgi:hypothetical protein
MVEVLAFGLWIVRSCQMKPLYHSSDLRCFGGDQSAPCIIIPMYNIYAGCVRTGPLAYLYQYSLRYLLAQFLYKVDSQLYAS